jgi:hypothetical protein
VIPQYILVDNYEIYFCVFSCLLVTMTGYITTQNETLKSFGIRTIVDDNPSHTGYTL